MTVCTIGTRSRNSAQEEAGLPLQIDLASCQMTELGPEQSVMNTPGRLMEGIAALDYFQYSK